MNPRPRYCHKIAHDIVIISFLPNVQMFQTMVSDVALEKRQ